MAIVKEEAAMAWYQIYYVDHDQRRNAADHIEASSPDTALAIAQRSFARYEHPAFELWQEGRKLHSEARSPHQFV
jgi:hypothetical protein